MAPKKFMNVAMKAASSSSKLPPKVQPKVQPKKKATISGSKGGAKLTKDALAGQTRAHEILAARMSRQLMRLSLTWRRYQRKPKNRCGNSDPFAIC